jgi:uncharacterized membrane-anchored protein YhcB (DUF1043 family)
MLAAAWITAICTAVLAVGAIVTAVFAFLAFRTQSDELAALQRQSKDSAEQLDLQRAQIADQQALNQEQIKVLQLQAQELAESMTERKAEAESARRAQAAKVNVWFGYWDRLDITSAPGAVIRNGSDLPILDVRVFFHWVSEQSDGTWTSVNRGGPVERVRVIAPEHQMFVEMPEQIRTMTAEVNDQVYVVSLEFTDAAGQRWIRDPHGGLVPA